MFWFCTSGPGRFMGWGRSTGCVWNRGGWWWSTHVVVGGGRRSNSSSTTLLCAVAAWCACGVGWCAGDGCWCTGMLGIVCGHARHCVRACYALCVCCVRCALVWRLMCGRWGLMCGHVVRCVLLMGVVCCWCAGDGCVLCGHWGAGVRACLGMAYGVLGHPARYCSALCATVAHCFF